MEGSKFLLICVFTWISNQVNADQMCEGEIEVEIGERLTLISNVERLQSCHFVFTEDIGREQCCYNKEGREEDCEKDKIQGNTKCLMEDEYVVTIDGRGTGTCNLTIESVSEYSAGHYRSYTADDEPIQECIVKVVKVKGEGAQGSVAKPVMAVLAILLAVTVAVVVTILVRRGSIKFTLVDGKESEREQLARCP